jgi:hypothetical protein
MPFTSDRKSGATSESDFFFYWISSGIYISIRQLDLLLGFPLAVAKASIDYEFKKI